MTLISIKNSLLPARLPDTPLHVTNDGVAVSTSPWQRFKRSVMPGYAAQERAEVANYFSRFFQEFISQDSKPWDATKLKRVVDLSQQYIDRLNNKGESADLQRYLLATRLRLNHFDAKYSREKLTVACRSANSGLATKWEKLGFAKEAFFTSPDLVNFIFQTHLHRHIRHPFLNHTIEMRTQSVVRNGKVQIVREPSLLCEGQQVAWSKIRTRIKADASGVLYSSEKGRKRAWLYLDRGFVPWNRLNYAKPRHVTILQTPPASCRIEVVTTHAKPDARHLGDRVLHGARHSYFRVIFGKDFAKRNPSAGIKDGSLYCIGWGAVANDFSLGSPLATIGGTWYCPDGFEFFKEDRCVTPIPVSDAKALAILSLIKKRKQEECAFNAFYGNCADKTGSVLKELAIATIDTKEHLGSLLYRFCLPECVRNALQPIATAVARRMPRPMMAGLEGIGKFSVALLFSPVFFVLGATKANVSGQKREQVKAKSLVDLFKPSTMTLGMTNRIYLWQQQQKGTYLERVD